MIKIVRGAYGYLDKNGIVRPKTAADAPFSLLPDQEARLVKLGIAEYVGAVSVAEEAPAERNLADYSVKELRELGSEYGLTFKVGTSKADMVKAIENAQAEVDIETVDDDDESAPVFDASEAVQ